MESVSAKLPVMFNVRAVKICIDSTYSGNDHYFYSFHFSVCFQERPQILSRCTMYTRLIALIAL